MRYDSGKNNAAQFLHQVHHYKSIQGIIKTMLKLMLTKMT